MQYQILIFARVLILHYEITECCI